MNVDRHGLIICNGVEYIEIHGKMGCKGSRDANEILIILGFEL